MPLIFHLQKASMWKRISAWLLDAILLVIMATLLAVIISAVTGYDGYVALYDERCTAVEAQYGVSRNTTMAEIEAMDAAARANWDAANEAIATDPQALHAYSMLTQLMVLIASLSIAGAFAVMEFAIPLALKNGQTISKKIFGIAVMRVDGVRINTLMMFVRTMLGKCTIETLLPVMAVLCISQMGLLGLGLAALVMIINVVLIIASQENALLHDKMACTATVDMASQMIFDTPEDLLAWKTRQHAEKAAEKTL